MPSSLRTCPQGHHYRKSSDCPVCPVCEGLLKPQSGFLATLGGPARRALENVGVTTLAKLASKRETEILASHGMGPASLPILRAALNDAGLTFKP